MIDYDPESINNDPKYHKSIHYEAAIYHDTNTDYFHVKVAETVEEACKLIEAGFEYVTEIEDKKLFRKRK